MASPDTPLPVRPGTYVLVVCLDRDVTIRVGGLGAVRLPAGFYAYAGSALGPGGIAARVGRHARGANGVHWHIDHLRRFASAREAWYATGRLRREHVWARALPRLSGGATSIAGFGASDCRCPSHLVYFAAPPAIAEFRRTLDASRRASHRRTPGRRDELIERVTFT